MSIMINDVGLCMVVRTLTTIMSIVCVSTIVRTIITISTSIDHNTIIIALSSLAAPPPGSPRGRSAWRGHWRSTAPYICVCVCIYIYIHTYIYTQ